MLARAALLKRFPLVGVSVGIGHRREALVCLPLVIDLRPEVGAKKKQAPLSSIRQAVVATYANMVTFRGLPVLPSTAAKVRDCLIAGFAC